MVSASETLDGLEQLARDPQATMRVHTLVSGICRIDVEVLDGQAHWRVNGLVSSRQTAVSALEDARAARG